MDKRETIINRVKTYKELVNSSFPIKIDQFWLFGSHAKGSPNKDSDIDVALVVERLNEDYDFFETGCLAERASFCGENSADDENGRKRCVP